MTSRVALFLAVACLSAQSQPPSFPETPAGRLAARYFPVFNSADENAIRGFLRSHIADRSLERMPVDERTRRELQMRSRIGAVTVLRIEESRTDVLSVIVRNERGTLLRFEFQCEPATPHKLLSLAIDRIESDEPPDPAPNDAELVARAQEFLKASASKDQFSGVVLIARAGTILFNSAFGLADRERGIPVTPDTKFNIGSINKTFTALGIHMLAAEGKLRLDDPIGRFLEEYPNSHAATTVTIRHLLDMSSGIGDIFGERYDRTPKSRLRTLRDFLPLFADQPLHFEPGSSTRYSNGGYIVLGLIIEHVSGMEYYEFIRSRIFRPAGMSQTDWYWSNEPVSDLAVGYISEGEKRTPNTETLPARGSSAGGGYSTAADLLGFVRALEKGMFHAPGYSGHQGLGIGGGAPGINAILEWDQRTQYAVIVLSNDSPPSAQRVSGQLRRWLPRAGR